MMPNRRWKTTEILTLNVEAEESGRADNMAELDSNMVVGNTDTQSGNDMDRNSVAGADNWQWEKSEPEADSNPRDVMVPVRECTAGPLILKKMGRWVEVVPCLLAWCSRCQF
jgi:hypothetical protein